MKTVGKSVIRKDAWAKVSGLAKYTDDFFMPGMLHAKLKRSTISSGRVVSIDVSKAVACPNVIAVFTYEDVPNIKFATAGHPWSLDSRKRDIEDRKILTRDIHYHGDEIAVVVAEDEFSALQATKLIEVEYEEYPSILTVEEALAPGACEIEPGSKNLIKNSNQSKGDLAKAFENSDLIFEKEYSTQIVQQCAMENHIAYAYMEDPSRITVVSSTQIPHICRRIVGQALGRPWGDIRIVKPYIGGGFGSKQDVIVEPIVAFLTQKLNGRPVKLNFSREETFCCTRTRHPKKYKMKVGVTKEGIINGWSCRATTAAGGYASHGHSCIARDCNKMLTLYPVDHYYFEATSTYSNTPVAGAMRSYGTAQAIFMLESVMEDIADELGMDSMDFRLKNLVDENFIEPTTERKILSYGIKECIEKGKEAISWDNKKRDNRNFNRKMEEESVPLRRGIGMALMSYNPFSYPGLLEMAGARIVLNQDGTVHLQVGATEIGQGSDTVMAQIAAEAIGISYEKIHVVSTQDTDITPYDSGAYASRQTYVSGQAVKKAGLELGQKILEYAHKLYHIPIGAMTIQDGSIVFQKDKKEISSVADVAMNSFYNKEIGELITADVSNNLHTNALVYGACFVQIEVDIELGKISVQEIHDVIDAGTIINPGLAEGQVHGCVSMGLGYALSEELLLNETGKVLNGNLLDYKLPTIMDTPEMGVHFVETHDPSGPYGCKGLGEPPTVLIAPAIRNAVHAATGVAIYSLPMSPQKLFNAFKDAGLI